MRTLTVMSLLTSGALLVACGTPTNPSVEDDLTTFEADWGDWTHGLAGDTVAGRQVAHTFELIRELTGADGQCAWLEASNATGSLYQWLERRIALSAGLYRIALSWDIAPPGSEAERLYAFASVLADGPLTEPHEVPFGVIELGPIGTQTAGTVRSFFSERVLSVDKHITITVGYRNGFPGSVQGKCFDNIRIRAQRLDK